MLRERIVRQGDITIFEKKKYAVKGIEREIEQGGKDFFYLKVERPDLITPAPEIFDQTIRLDMYFKKHRLIKEGNGAILWKPVQIDFFKKTLKLKSKAKAPSFDSFGKEKV